MKPLLQIVPVLLALCAGAAQAQLYKWVGPDGKITYTDTPPPPAAAKVEKRAVPGVTSTGGELPYELARAARNHPVTLYTSSNCAPCDDGRKLLNTRGIPFAEKTVSTAEDGEQLRKVGGDTSLPLLTVGRAQQRGFETDAWNAALTAAGYPATSQLPRTYRNQPPEPAAPRVQQAKATREPAPSVAAPPPPPSATELPPATGNAPPGFRF